MAGQTPIRIGVLGCGHWGPNHVRVFSQLADSAVVGAADPDPVRRTALAELHPNLPVWADHRELLAHARPDAVVVAAPTRVHLPLVQDALAAGCHVLCEKPLCPSADEAAQLVRLARDAGRLLMTGHVFLFNAGIRRLKELLHDPASGPVHCLRATRTNLGPIRSDVNVVLDLASHDVAILNHLLDARPESVSATGAAFLQPGVEDVAFLSLRYPGNILAHVHVSWLDPKKVREIIAVTGRRMLAWDDLASPGPISIYDKGVTRPPDYPDYGAFQLLAREGDLTIPKVRVEEPLKVQNRFFLESIRAGRLAFNDGDFAVGVLRVLEAVNQSLAAGGAPVTVPS